MNQSKLAQVDFQHLEEVAAPNFAGKGIADFFSGDSGLITYFFFFAGAALLVYLVMGGFGLMTSGGDPKKLQGSKAQITNALIGFIIVFTSYMVVQALGLILGLEGITNVFGQ